jgi:hypothetical protein
MLSIIIFNLKIISMEYNPISQSKRATIFTFVRDPKNTQKTHTVHTQKDIIYQ